MSTILPDLSPGFRARVAGRAWLSEALEESRARTLALSAAFERGLAGTGMTVPLSAQLNPPAWELGHIGWFQDWWISRNRERASGIRCDPFHPRAASRLAQADALYDSSNVPHDSRWSLPLPGVAATRAYLRAGLDETLALLAAGGESDDDLYFFRLVLLHEDMHAEAAVYMAQALGIAIEPAAAFPGRMRTAPVEGTLELPAASWRTGGGEEAGFAFDNELGARPMDLAAFEIDAAPVTWARYLPAVEQGAVPVPRYLRRGDVRWERQVFGEWQALDPGGAAVHLALAEVQAWCRWSGRRLPTEAEWEYAACTQRDFAWGEVWEWTASAFESFPGFTPHPYRDYSAPWFGTRQVLRGASRATHPRMAHPRYRNFFTPERNDIFAGFRSRAP